MNRALTPTVEVPAAGWTQLRAFTDARVALGRAGVSQPTAAHLAFQLAHAQARDAVHLPLDVSQVIRSLAPLRLPTVALHSAAPDRAAYLRRPDWGRRLDDVSRQKLADVSGADHSAPCDLALVVADGLSALAVHRQAAAVLVALQALLREGDSQDWRLAPVAVVEQGRVAIGDEIGLMMGARCVVVLIGERPGLSSPDSLGIYLTWAPRVGCPDADRNCISNVRAAGLSATLAAQKLLGLLSQARRHGVSGIALKDESDAVVSLQKRPGALPSAST